MNSDNYRGRDNLEVMTEAKNYNQMLVDLIQRYLGKPGPILDFGAGIGTFDHILRDQGYQVSCLEVDPHMVAELHGRGYTVWSDSQKIPDHSMQGIFSLNVFEHIKEDQAALLEAVRILAPGGTLLIYVPAFPILISNMDHRVGHFRRYRMAQLTGLIRQTGLSLQTVRYVDSLGFAATLIYKAIGNRDGSLNQAAIRFFDRWLFPLNRLFDPILGKLLGKNLLVVAKKLK